MSDSIFDSEKEYLPSDTISNAIAEYHLIDSIYETIYEWILDNPLEISSENFLKVLHENVVAISYTALCGILEIDELNNEDEEEEFDTFVQECISIYMLTIIRVPRSHPHSSDRTYCLNRVAIFDKLERLHMANECVPIQRSQEWYQFRSNLLTATNIGKVMGSEASVNSIIVEKCTPLLFEQQVGVFVNVNVDSPMHWGQKYEPVTISVYENIHDTKIKEFGCLQHFDKELKCIGASPDGINIDPSCASKFGRMIEVKNIVNREITGIPQTKYWIQMQIQMEVCDLEECDFVETRFKEYTIPEDIYSDTEHDTKGVILYFVSKRAIGTNKPHYIYMPLDVTLDEESVDEWTRKQQRKLYDTYILFQSITWYMDEMSTIMVPRNREWFAAATPKILETWKTIEIERVTGYAHRMPRQRTLSEPVSSSGSNTGSMIEVKKRLHGCLISVDDAYM